jgi:GT2 family glycosyltransferase
VTLSDRIRSAARRILGRPPSDWAGRDASRAEGLAGERIEAGAPFDVVWLSGRGDEGGGAPAQVLASAGHRVFRVSRGAPPTDSPYELRSSGPNRFDASVPLDPDAAFRGLDALRRDLGLGATAAVVGDPAWDAVAARLGRELAWARADPPAPGASPREALAEAFPLASVVVVTWQNRELNRLCLESLLSRTEWPRLEVLVVDNGSTDGTPQLLAEAAARDPRVTVLALGENRGFSAACNAGLARARGDLLVLLNNDTVSTRGWVAALARHLFADPRLGLVGPSTNAIANAARVEAGYRRLRDLPAWAAAFTRAHDGELEDVGSLAFFCVAMRRETWERVGPLDERFGIGMFEDGDYCRRVRDAGLEIRCARDAFVHHWQMASFRRMRREEYLALYEENRRRFEEKWRG